MMKMFFKKHEKSNNKSQVFSVQNGKVIPVSEVNDEAFAAKILGDGVAVKPEGGLILSPVNGKIINIASTYHAYGILTDDGMEILVHIGVDTVKLNGKGFENLVKVDDEVKVGTPLCNVDFPFVKQSGYDTDVIILLTNMDDCNGLPVFHTGITAVAGKTCVIEYTK